MATARAQGGLKGECLEPRESEKSHYFLPDVCDGPHEYHFVPGLAGTAASQV